MSEAKSAVHAGDDNINSKTNKNRNNVNGGSGVVIISIKPYPAACDPKI